MADLSKVTALVSSLTPTEFELLLRMYIEVKLSRAIVGVKGVERTNVHFHWESSDSFIWAVEVGSGWGNCCEAKGEIFALTADEAVRQWNARQQNKLNLLGYEPKVKATDEAPF